MTAITPQAPVVPGRLEQMSTRIAFFIAGFGIAAWAPLVPYAKARALVQIAVHHTDRQLAQGRRGMEQRIQACAAIRYPLNECFAAGAVKRFNGALRGKCLHGASSRKMRTAFARLRTDFGLMKTSIQGHRSVGRAGFFAMLGALAVGVLRGDRPQSPGTFPMADHRRMLR